MSVEDKRSDESDYCPDCKGLLEIAAINLTSQAGMSRCSSALIAGWRGPKPATPRAVNYVTGFQRLNVCCGS